MLINDVVALYKVLSRSLFIGQAVDSDRGITAVMRRSAIKSHFRHFQSPPHIIVKVLMYGVIREASFLHRQRASRMYLITMVNTCIKLPRVLSPQGEKRGWRVAYRRSR